MTRDILGEFQFHDSTYLFYFHILISIAFIKTASLKQIRKTDSLISWLIDSYSFSCMITYTTSTLT
jgi:hypothetical protein